MDLKSKIILIYGPTASGKSKFAVKLAKKINGEIINADSMQVYKELKILTARPKKIDQKKIKHHLYGIQSVKRDFSSGKWLKHANKKIKEIRKRNKIPIGSKLKGPLLVEESSSSTLVLNEMTLVVDNFANLIIKLDM